jgi:tripartite motif-containing protein 2/3/tripartite motif-containing protein 71
MAEEVLKKVEEQLNCSVCLDTYTDPKLLQCFHTYCQQCLVPLVIRDQEGELGITCPSCRQVTPVPGRGVAGLQSAFLINRLLQIRESSQNLGIQAATLEGAVPTDVNPIKQGSHCFVHEDKKCKLYCETCEELICWKCVLKGGKHHDHDYDELHEAFQKYKLEITSSLEPMEEQVTTIMRALAELDARCGEISDQRAATAVSIHVTFRRLREALDVRETELIGQLDKITQGKLKRLATQTDQIETTLAQQSSCLHFMRESLRTDDEEDVLMMKSNTVRQVKELTTPLQPDILKPNTEADLQFSTTVNMLEACQNYGEIFSGSPDPSKCHLTGKGAQVGAVGETSTAVLKACNLEGTPCKGPIEAFDCIVVSMITGTRTSCSVERRGQSQYEISYQPTIKGRHQLHVKAEGQHILGSPFPIAVKSSIEKLGTPVQTIGGLNRPRGVAINQRGEVVVAECGGDCFSVFSPSGKKLLSCGYSLGRIGQFHSPHEIALDGDGNILVVDSGNHCIQKFTPAGQFLTSVGTRGSRPLQFRYPCDITFNASNAKWYVTDSENNRIQVLNSNLTFYGNFGSRGDDKGQFRNPIGIACDSTGKVYVTDSSNHRIQVFTKEGKFVMKIGNKKLDRPYGIAIDTSDMVYVSEEGNSRVSVFTSEGQFVMSFGRKGKGPGCFQHPRGLAVDNSGVVYVCDRGSNRVHIF